MPRISVDGRSIECKDRQMILQACNDAGVAIPQYCYHPGLSIPASCRICLVEVEGIPKLVPSCQTPVRDGMTVYTKSTKAIAIVVSQSSGTARIFQNGQVVLRIEPLRRAMKWQEFESEPPPPPEWLA